MNRLPASLSILLLVAGCATTPAPRYYTLDMHPSGVAAGLANLRVDRLRESEPLARRNILIQPSPTQIEYYALDQWAAALSDLVRQKLQAEFGDPIPAQPAILVSGAIIGFGQVDTADGAQARAKLALEFRREGAARSEKPLLAKTYEAALPLEAAKPRAAAVAKALSLCVQKIAAEAASDAARL